MSDWGWSVQVNETNPDPRVAAAIEAAKEALRLGPSQYTNYYAIRGMTTGRPPAWASEGTCPATTHQLGNHTFCALQGTRNRSMEEVLAAEGATSLSTGIPTDSNAGAAQ